jgi:hypothetical protein
LVAAIVVGWGLSSSTAPGLGSLLGFLLTPAAKAGTVGESNVGVVVAFGVGGVAYAALSRVSRARR